VTAQVVPVAIPAGEAVSASIDTSVGEVAYVLMPGEWDGANLTFQISSDNVTFWDLFDQYGAEVMVACRSATAVRVPLGVKSVGFMRIRSGRRDSPIAQSESRNFKIVFS